MARSGIKHTSEQKWIVGSVAFGAFMCTLDSSIVNISLPTIARYFDVGTGAVSWVILAYLLAIVALLLPAGKLGDTIGQKRTFLIGYGLFTTGSLLCGVAPSLAFLIAARCFQGMGSALLITSAYAIVPRFMPKEATGWAFGMLATAGALGVTCGAPLGGFITGFFSWRWIFLINVPVGAVAILAARRSLPAETVRPGPGGLARFDIPGAVLGAAGLLSLLLALNLGQEAGWTSLPILAAFGAAAVLLPVFLLWERRRPEPSFDIRLLADRQFAAGVLASGMAYMAYAGNNFMMPFYLELAKHLTTQWVGPVMMVLSVVMMAVGPNAGRLSDRIPPKYLTTSGMVLAMAAFTAFSFTFPLPGLFVPIGFLVLMGISFGSFFSPNNSQVMSLAPAGRHGVSSGLLVTVNNLSMAVGICLMETVFTLMMPPGVGVKDLSQPAHVYPKGALAGGYRAALLAAAVICAGASLTSSFVKARPKAGAETAGGML